MDRVASVREVAESLLQERRVYKPGLYQAFRSTNGAANFAEALRLAAVEQKRQEDKRYRENIKFFRSLGWKG